MAKNIVMVLGIVFVLIGILGFFNNPVLSLFGVNTLHNLVHLVSGILAIAFAVRGEAAARSFAKIFGVVYLLVAILGFIAPGFMMSLLAVDGADNILHILLAIVFLGVGFMGNSSSTAKV